jgi:hypothetical protein
LENFPEAQPAFGETAVKEIIAATGLSLAPGWSIRELENRLEDIAWQHYWNEFTPPDRDGKSDVIELGAIADVSVTPSRLKNRLVSIEQSSQRIFAGSSRRPMAEKIEELLRRLGRNKNGSPLKQSGTEASGHGGSERSAIWLCLVRAIAATESPPKDYKPNTNGRPWPSQRLEETLQGLVRCIQSPDQDQKDAVPAARMIHIWIQWSIPLIQQLITSDKARHLGNAPLVLTLSNLDTLYREAFGKRPSLYRSSVKGSAPKPNSWELFLQAVLGGILPPEDLPSITALDERWRRLTYQKR